MIRRSYSRRSRRLNESVNCPALKWVVDKYLPYEGVQAYPTMNGEEYFFDTWILDLHGTPEGTIRMNAGMGYLEDEVQHEIHGTLDDGKRICEELWNAVCAASEFCDINEEVFKAIARKQGWHVS